MKQLILVLFLFTTITSCKKDNQNNQNQNTNKYDTDAPTKRPTMVTRESFTGNKQLEVFIDYNSDDKPVKFLFQGLQPPNQEATIEYFQNGRVKTINTHPELGSRIFQFEHFNKYTVSTSFEKGMNDTVVYHYYYNNQRRIDSVARMATSPNTTNTTYEGIFYYYYNPDGSLDRVETHEFKNDSIWRTFSFVEVSSSNVLSPFYYGDEPTLSSHLLLFWLSGFGTNKIKYLSNKDCTISTNLVGDVDTMDYGPYFYYYTY